MPAMVISFVVTDAIIFAMTAFPLALATSNTGVMTDAIVFAVAAFTVTTPVIATAHLVAVLACLPRFGPRFSMLFRPIALLAARPLDMERLLMP